MRATVALNGLNIGSVYFLWFSSLMCEFCSISSNLPININRRLRKLVHLAPEAALGLVCRTSYHPFQTYGEKFDYV